ncbi:pyridoxamine 5'-phosphate oxidase family protein [Streptomyces scopuliridis]|uniref:pyridoxamine 5'-phosphate oxidase family protein n=1 Tax=Streptomyces scopuliridis TaxID=452529 RepID=UPI00369BCBEF
MTSEQTSEQSSEPGTDQSSGPAPRILTDAALSDFLGERQFGTLATVKRDGHPHLTTMVYGWDPGERIVRFSTTADRLKVRQIRNNPRVALHVSSDDHWTFAVAEGEAELSGPSAVAGDAVGRELLTLLPAAARPQDPTDEAEFLARQVTERRLVIRLRVGKLYGTALDIA